LIGERTQLERDRAAVEDCYSEASAAVTAELNAARDKISALTTSLLNRTEELRTLDQRRSEATTEMERARAREKELEAALDEQKRAADEERTRCVKELRQLRELLGRRTEAPAAVEQTTPAQPAAPSQSKPAASGAPVTSRQNPVLGSIVQQFDKLRQQRASDRHAANKPR
jgi:chromosome segregation ATPase